MVFMFPEYPFDSTPSHSLKDISGGSPIIFFNFYFWGSYSSHFRERQCALDLGFQSLCGLGPPIHYFHPFWDGWPRGASRSAWSCSSLQLWIPMHGAPCLVCMDVLLCCELSDWLLMGKNINMYMYTVLVSFPSLK